MNPKRFGLNADQTANPPKAVPAGCDDDGMTSKDHHTGGMSAETMAILADESAKFVELSANYMAQLRTAGFPDEVATLMAADFHSAILRKALGDD